MLVEYKTLVYENITHASKGKNNNIPTVFEKLSSNPYNMLWFTWDKKYRSLIYKHKCMVRFDLNK